MISKKKSQTVACEFCGESQECESVAVAGERYPRYKHEMIIVSVVDENEKTGRKYHDFCSFYCVMEWAKERHEPEI